MRALITGGGGFVGQWLAGHLRTRGDEVVCVDHEVDVTDSAAIARVLQDEEPAAVYHLAALSHVGRSWSDPAEVFRVNALGTLNVLEAARTCPSPPKVLVTSSAEVYGAAKEDQMPLRESSALAPVTPYGASKVAAEFLALQANLAYGLEVFTVRPFNHIGPGQATQFVVSSLASQIVTARRRGERQVPVGNLSARRDLTDVRDVVRAYRLLIERGAPGEIYNVCSGVDISIEEVAAMLMKLAGVQLDLVTDPSLTRPVDAPLVRGDPRKLRADTGWQPEIPLEQSLGDVLDYFEEQVT